MRLLLDTHVFLWWDRELQRVPTDIRAAIENGGNDVFVSAATVWEIAIKRALGKLEFAVPIVATIGRCKFQLLPISAAHAEYAGGLPRHHNDPFDRMLVAQAVLEGLVLATEDPLLRPYRVPLLGLDQ